MSRYKIEVVLHREELLIYDTETGEANSLPLRQSFHKKLVQLLHDESYDKDSDIFYLPSLLIKLGEELGVK